MIAEITNNYGNIRASKSYKWIGQIGEYNGFVKFSSVDYGLRALYILINRYITYYDLQDVSSIITRYAPPSENDTQGYIRYVEQYLLKCGYSSKDFRPSDKRLPYLCVAIVFRECGKVVSPNQIKFAKCL